MNIDIIIPSFNGSNLLKSNLPILIKETKKYEIKKIIIVDDGSASQESINLYKLINNIKKKLKVNILLLKNDKNMGFSSTVNKGVAASKADFVVLLNTDVIATPNFLDAALNDLRSDKNIFGVGMMDKSVESDGTVLRGRGIASWKRGFLVHKKGEVSKKDTFWISGGSSIIRREIFNKLSGFNPLYNPFYWEDIDLSYRAMKSGYSIMFNYKSVVEHRHSEGAIKKYFKNSQIKIIAYRNQFIFVWKNITDVSLLINHLFWLPYHFLKSIVISDIAFFIGFLKALSILPKIVASKNREAKMYKISDRELLN